METIIELYGHKNMFDWRNKMWTQNKEDLKQSEQTFGQNKKWMKC